MKFKDVITEQNKYEYILSFYENLTDYIDVDDKSVSDEIIEEAKKLGYITKKTRVYRYDCKEPNLSVKILSTSTEKLKGKVLKNIETDMIHKSKTLGNLKGDCEPKYYELENVKGIDVVSLLKNSKIIKDKELKEYVDNLYKRIKSEKEFMVFP